MNALIPCTLSALTLDSYCRRAIAPISEESRRFLIPSPNLPAFGDSSNGSEPHPISARKPKYKSLELCEGERPRRSSPRHTKPYEGQALQPPNSPRLHPLS